MHGDILFMHNGDVIHAVILQEIAPTPEEIKAAEAHIKAHAQPTPKHDVDGKSAPQAAPRGSMLPEEEFVLELTQSVPLLHLRLVRACMCNVVHDNGCIYECEIFFGTCVFGSV